MHWAKKVTEVIPQKEVGLKLDATSEAGQGEWTFTLAQDQLAKLRAPCLRATWSGSYDVFLNGEQIKRVRYNLPNVPAGWHVPPQAAQTLRTGKNKITVRLVGPGKETKPGAALATRKPFLRLGLFNWSRIGG